MSVDMGFVFVQTSYLRHPKIVGLHERAVLLHLASILWTAEHLTDGYVPVTALRSLCDEAGIGARWRDHRVRDLVSRQLWDELPEGWHVHDFEDWNRSSTRAVVESNRAAAVERQRRHRERQDRESRRD